MEVFLPWHLQPPPPIPTKSSRITSVTRNTMGLSPLVWTAL